MPLAQGAGWQGSAGLPLLLSRGGVRQERVHSQRQCVRLRQLSHGGISVLP